MKFITTSLAKKCNVESGIYVCMRWYPPKIRRLSETNFCGQLKSYCSVHQYDIVKFNGKRNAASAYNGYCSRRVKWICPRHSCTNRTCLKLKHFKQNELGSENLQPRRNFSSIDEFDSENENDVHQSNWDESSKEIETTKNQEINPS